MLCQYFNVNMSRSSFLFLLSSRVVTVPIPLEHILPDYVLAPDSNVSTLATTVLYLRT